MVLSLIGERGMGEFYRARDTTLDPEVAIKGLPDAVAGGSERLARFEREAKTLAALNHPNVAQIDAMESGTMVMELTPRRNLIRSVGHTRHRRLVTSKRGSSNAYC